MVRYSHQDALSESEFQALLDAVDDMDEPFRTECRFILVAGGRLGMRAGEITHFREDWVDWGRSVIDIPRFQDCDCGYCRSQAQQSARKRDRPFDVAMSEFWSPKTPDSARAIPFDFSDLTRETVEEFTFLFDRFERSRSAINRRVDRMLDAAGMRRDACYPHALRATAATWHAYRGLPPVALQSLMGWSQLSVAQKYLRLSGGATQEALRETHSDD